MALVDTGACQKAIEVESDAQIARILQMDIADEQSASSTYDKQLEGIQDEHIKEVLTEIRNDEYDHIKKLQALIAEINPDYDKGSGEASAIESEDSSDNESEDISPEQKEHDEREDRLKKSLAGRHF